MGKLNLEQLLLDGVSRKASDVHFSSGRSPSYRIDGELVDSEGDQITPEQMEEMIFPLLNERLQRELDLEGEVDFAYSIYGVGRFRINVYKQRGSLASAMRILPFEIPKPMTLGIPEAVVELTERKRGLVLVTGATGSGKSTTLASLINVINHTRKEHIITLEDPIEYLHRHDMCEVDQREIGCDTKTYAHALRAALRQDPDVILVGEMRDLETISTAITAAETGHLVFSTLHTNNAASTIDRIIDVFPPYQQQQIRIQLASVLECIVSQQLLPLKSGKGRVAAMEVLFANSAIRNLIREAKSYQIPTVMQTNKKAGMQTMDDALYRLFIQNKITQDDTINFAQDPIGMSKKVSFE